MINAEQLSKFAPSVHQDDIPNLVDAINQTLTRFGITDGRRVRYFMAQTAHETTHYTKWSEDLVYTHPERLVVVWPFRFTMDKNDQTKMYAPDYVNNAEKLSNLVYAGREGNGSAQTGDGYRYRGRGGLDLTFKANYASASDYLYSDDRLVQNPDQVSQFDVGMMTAGWFWNAHHFNNLADSDSFTQMTKIIQGSTESVPLRLEILKVANTIF